MSPTVRPGMFRPLVHSVPDVTLWVTLGGRWTRRCGLAGRRVPFAACGSPCWPDAPRPAHLPPCPACFPKGHDLM
jgi:hypothetical protein